MSTKGSDSSLNIKGHIGDMLHLMSIYIVSRFSVNRIEERGDIYLLA
jgi:hypothetical protein